MTKHCSAFIFLLRLVLCRKIFNFLPSVALIDHGVIDATNSFLKRGFSNAFNLGNEIFLNLEPK